MATDRTTLDHIAVAMEDHRDAVGRYVEELGGVFNGHGIGVGFSPLQVQYEGGMKIEMLRPSQVEVNDFLRRFLDRSGPGPHHLTFKVPDIHAAIAASESAGYPVINVDTRFPQWMEGFLHPKLAHGIVVQLAQSESDGGDWLQPPRWFPDAQAPTATLDHVEHWVASLPAATSLFRDLLAGEGVDQGDGWLQLRWPSGSALRLVDASGGERAAWVGSLTGRVRHIAFAVDDPAAVRGAKDLGDGRFEVAPEDNLGVRLILRRR